MYDYYTERSKLFTEEGQLLFIKIRDKVNALLVSSGAFRESEALKEFTGDSWLMMACLDRLVELKEIEVVPRRCWRQFQIYSTPQKHNAKGDEE